VRHSFLITFQVIDKPRRVQHFRVRSRLAPASSFATRFDFTLMQRVEAQGANVMGMTNQAITRRTALSAAIGAIGTLPISNGKADDESPLRGPYKIEDWGNTWRNPSKARVLARVPAIAMPDIAGYWPQTTRPVRGPPGVCQADH
jgi:hypothetical protein